ncbi:hypothetical protein Q8A67_009562 [Cirrhinus molitorella]|uniref:Uncharacterized protein n=1 Tax=Cirrhinus molitorella TaxID=172907 RepID=A0AA88U063_9TELE|nr:hypothetical protein Q8A67_009562 [Cirrhinus molitorella]
MAQAEDMPKEVSAEGKGESESAGEIKRARTMALYNPIPAKHNCLTVNRLKSQSISFDSRKPSDLIDGS